MLLQFTKAYKALPDRFPHTKTELCECGRGRPKHLRSVNEIWSALLSVQLTGAKDDELRQELLVEFNEAINREIPR